ncbi:MAG: nucleotide-diphospho-sugar transferase [Bacteroidetes bacterium]|nr:nucleotide-diphospho-sugar transferase [Bacteroidota bacterium]
MSIPPILLITFNRPDTVAKVIQALRRWRPPVIYFASDGPRAHKAGEAEAVTVTRALTSTIDWPCRLHTRFSTHNLGCKQGVSSAISWFFAHEPAGIILEDDIVPGEDFFTYCTALLDKYAEDPRVYHISSINYRTKHQHLNASYYASHIPHVWGWAGWRDKWARYQDAEQHLQPEEVSAVLQRTFPRPEMVQYFAQRLEAIRQGASDSWSLIWAYTLWRENGLSLTPKVNLSTNIGMGIRTSGANFRGVSHRGTFGFYPTRTLNPLVHPATLQADNEKDLWVFSRVIRWNFRRKLKNKLWSYWERISPPKIHA